MNAHLNSLAVFNLGGGEIILIFFLLLILAVAAVAFFGLIYLIVRAAQKRPVPVQPALPPEAAVQNQEKRDREHLKLLSIFHFVFAGLSVAGMAFLCLHYAIMHTVFTNPAMWKSQRADMPPKAFLDVFIWFYIFVGVILFVVLVLNALSGLFLWHRRNRLFSLIIGGMNCMQMPFGTALGVFTILVLSRESVRDLYANPPR